MSVPNELTPEEEAEFLAMGADPIAPGIEPNSEAQIEAAQPASAHADRERDEHGRFKPVAAEAPVVAGASATLSATPVPVVEAEAPPPGFVPHAALHQERMRSQEVARQMAVLQARTNALLTARQQETAPLPNMQEDPVAYLTALEQQVADLRAEREEEAQYRQIDSALSQDEAAYTAAMPDYTQASDHYVDSRARELIALGYGLPQVSKQMQTEVRQMAQAAWQQGVPAAERIYQMALARGYRPGQPPAQEPAPQLPTPPAVQQPVLPAAAPARGVTPTAAIAAARAGQQATRTLSGGMGAAPAAALNAEALLSMSDEEFEQHFQFGAKGANARFANVG